MFYSILNESIILFWVTNLCNGQTLIKIRIPNKRDNDLLDVYYKDAKEMDVW